MIYLEALLYRLLVVVGTSALLTALYEALHEFFLGYVQLYHCSNLVTTLLEHLLQSLCLRYGTWETVEYHSFVTSSVSVVHVSQYRNHQLVGNKIAAVNIAGSEFSQLCTFLYLATQHVSCRDVSQSVVLYHQLTLCSFSGTRSTENYYILHFD